MAIDEAKLNEFMNKAVGDIGAAMSAALIIIGDKLGLYKALAAAGPCTPAQLAKLTKTKERYIREWLNNQAAGGYAVYDAASGCYSLTPEQALALADESSPVFIPGAFLVTSATIKAVPRMLKNFKSGKGLDWCDHDASLFEGTERFFKPNYLGNLVRSWLPALEGVVAKLERGAKVADIGCGHGASTILMAKTFPKSQFTGFDYHGASIATAKKRAKLAGVSKNAAFKVADSTKFPGTNYDLVTHFDCLHDMGDPDGAAKHVFKTLAPEGTWMVVEPFANDRPQDNHNPVGRVYYAASTMICVPASIAHHGPALGAQAGEARLREIITGAGFKRFRRATQTPFNLVLEARK
jgi:ubiquinone/menaquinone biosynthesis C-methylase UbiE